MIDTDSVHARQKEDATGVHATVEYANPFRRPPVPFHQQFQQQQRQHYNVQIPSLQRWPTLVLEGLKTSAQFSAKAFRAIRDGLSGDDSHNSSRGAYQGLPMTHTTINSNSAAAISPFGRRHIKNRPSGASHGWTGRRCSRVVFFMLCLSMVIVWIFIVPPTLKPFRKNRDVWVRYFNHEEAVKITLPLQRRVHVSDVKRVAMKAIDQGYSPMSPSLGNIKLLTRHARRGWLEPDEEWDMDALFRFLNESLGCFSDLRAYNNNQNGIKFTPEYNDYSPLVDILTRLSDGEHNYFRERDIQYLWTSFNDPKKLSHSSHMFNDTGFWVRPKGMPQAGNHFFEEPIFQDPIFDTEVYDWEPMQLSTTSSL
ncbi:hypothetical protein EDD11_002465 [Mortierella claussenii]|nr:hypothetical protein EDD11_002465 [Mortierella claussenii]